MAFDGAPNVSECVSRAFCNVERYGFKTDSMWRVDGLTHQGSDSHWSVLRNGEHWAGRLYMRRISLRTTRHLVRTRVTPDALHDRALHLCPPARPLPS